MKKFTLYNKELIVDDARHNYNTIRNQYIKYAEKAREDFEISYKERFKNIDEVCNLEETGAYILGRRIIDLYIEKSIELMVDLGIFTISKNEFAIRFYESLSGWDEGFSVVYDKFLEIILDTKALAEYRELRKANRGRLIGGGFGIKGAAKGIMIAGAGNIITGAAHGIINGIGNVISSIKEIDKKKKLFESPYVLEALSVTLGRTVFNIHLLLVQYLIEEGYAVDFISDEDIKTAEAIIENIKDREVTEEKAKEIFLQTLKLNPYEEEIYFYIIKQCGDEQKEVEAIADFFEVDIKEYKYSILEKLYDSFKFDNKEMAIKNKEILMNEMKWLGYEEFNKFSQDIDHKIIMLDRKERTVRGILLDTVVEAEKARVEEVEINRLLKEDIWKSEEELLKVKDIISSQFTSAVAIQILGEVNEKLQEYDRLKRTIDGVEFLTVDEAEKARKEKEVARRLLLCVNWADKDWLQESLDLLLKNNTTNINNKDIERFKEKLECIDSKERTVEGITFKTHEEAEVAKNERRAVENILKNADLSTRKNAEEVLIKIKQNNTTNINTEQLQIVEEKFKDLDLRERTIRYIVFETIEEAQVARQKDEEIRKQIANIKSIKKLIYLKDKTNSEQYDIRLKSIHIEQLDNWINRKKKEQREKIKKCTIGIIIILIIIIFKIIV